MVHHPVSPARMRLSAYQLTQRYSLSIHQYTTYLHKIVILFQRRLYFYLALDYCLFRRCETCPYETQKLQAGMTFSLMEKAGLSREDQVDQQTQANHSAFHARVLQRLNRGSKGGSFHD